MSYQRLKSEKYTETGGINTKASLYVTGQKEVLDLVNYDFQIPGAWNPRPGTTTALIGNTLTIGSSQTITALWQITKAGALAYDLPEALPQNRILVGHDQGVFEYYNDIVIGFTQAQYYPLISGLTASNWNYVNYEDATYFCTPSDARSGNTGFYKYSPNAFPGPSAWSDGAAFFGMIKPTAALSATLISGPPANFPASSTFTYAYAMRDKLGFVGPIWGTLIVSTGVSGADTINISGFTTVSGLYDGVSFGFQDYALFRNRVAGFPSDQFVVIDYTTGAAPYPDTNILAAYSIIPEVVLTPETNTKFSPLYTKYPSLLEVFANRMWINNTDDLNRIEFSEVQEMQNFQPESFIQVTNSNYTVTGFKQFNQSMIFFLQKGVLRLTGDNPSNFNLQKITTEYGLISSKATVEFENKLWFLDDRGIIEFNGSATATVSNRVEGYFDRMNFTAAQERACATHYQERNEVWFCIPVDGATVNNIILVYDYLVDAWTTFQGDNIKPTAINEIYLSYGATLAYRNFNNRHMFFGSIGASLFYFDKSLKADNGQGITYTFKTLYHNELGKSRTAQFRRFYLDSGGYAGPTLTYGCQMFPNYSLIPGYTTPLYLSSFQERIDFGIPAAAMSVRATLGSTQAPIINGYTVEYRYQRDTGTNP